MPDANIVAFPRVIVCVLTRTTSAESRAWILCPLTVVTDTIASASLTGDESWGSGGGRVWAWPSAITIKAVGSEAIWCP